MPPSISGDARALPRASSAGRIPLPPGRTYVISLALVNLSTNNFNPAGIIAQGGESVIYKGVATDGSGKTWAVKHLHPNLDPRYFYREVEQIADIKHKNLLQLICYCNEENNRILVYEYMDKGSLGRLLWNQARLQGESLSFEDRLNIAIGAADGLEYLHNHLCVIHRDIKTDNILIDQANVAKIADFTTLKEDFADNERTRRLCSEGYLSPECHENGRSNLPLRCTRESDVYSFGVVLLSLLSSRPALTKSTDGNGKTVRTLLSKWVMEEVPDLLDVVKKRQRRLAVDLHLLVDERVWEGEERGYPRMKMQKFAELGIRCIRKEAAKRPDMNKVVTTLKNLVLDPGEDGEGEGDARWLDMRLWRALSLSSSLSSSSFAEDRSTHSGMLMGSGLMHSGSAKKPRSPVLGPSEDPGEFFRSLEETMVEIEGGGGGAEGSG